MNIEITPEMIEALRTLRKTYLYPPEQAAFDVLDNAGIFHKIDEATGYDIDSACTCPADERAKSGTGNHYIECPEAPVSKCTCLASEVKASGWDRHGAYADHAANCPEAPVSKCTCPPENVKFGGHLYRCPGDPAEYGDNAFTTARH